MWTKFHVLGSWKYWRALSLIIQAKWTMCDSLETHDVTLVLVSCSKNMNNHYTISHNAYILLHDCATKPSYVAQCIWVCVACVVCEAALGSARGHGGFTGTWLRFSLRTRFSWDSWATSCSFTARDLLTCSCEDRTEVSSSCKWDRRSARSLTYIGS